MNYSRLHTALASIAMAAVALGVYAAACRDLHCREWLRWLIVTQTIYLAALWICSAESLVWRWLCYGTPAVFLATLEGRSFHIVVQSDNERIYAALFTVALLAPTCLLMWLQRVALRTRIGPPEVERRLSVRDLFGLITCVAAFFGTIWAADHYFHWELRTQIFGSRWYHSQVLQYALLSFCCVGIMGAVFRATNWVAVALLSVITVGVCLANILSLVGLDSFDSMAKFMSVVDIRFEFAKATVFTTIIAGFCLYLRMQGNRLLFVVTKA